VSDSVGIGIVAPQKKLHISSSVIFDGIQIDSAANPTLLLHTENSGNSRDALISMKDGPTDKPLQFWNASSDITDTDRIFSFLNPATTQVLNILGNGNVGLGVGAPVYQLQLSQDSAAKPTTSTWTTTSDERLKTNIVGADLERCVSTIKLLSLKHFKWREEFYDNSVTTDRDNYGFIAQEVQTVLPSSVTVYPSYTIYKNSTFTSNSFTIVSSVAISTLTNFMTLNSDQIMKMHLGATQQLIQRIETLEAQVSTLIG
jgi:hypothetical protein